MTTQRVEADLEVGAFGLTLDGATRRLDFPRGELDNLRGTAGDLMYGAREVVLDQLHTRLDRTHWAAAAASAGDMYLRTVDDSMVLAIDRIEMPGGVQLTKSADGGVEIIAAHAILHEVRLTIPSFEPLRQKPTAEKAATVLRKVADIPLKQERLRVLDSLTGSLGLTLKVALDLPVVGVRTLDQKLKVPIENGSLDYRALEEGLSWLEGRFVNLEMKGDRLALSWRLPIFGKDHEIVSWQLDSDAQSLAPFDRVPLRSLADFGTPGGGKPADPGAPASKKKSVLRKLALRDLAVDLSMVAPQSVEIGGGTLRFGDDGQAGLVGLALTGGIASEGPGGLTGSISVLDMTAKDVPLGPLHLSVDRINFGAIEDVTVAFDGFKPLGLSAKIHRITATNLVLVIGGSGRAA